MLGRIVKIKNLKSLRKKLPGKKIVLVGGGFDILHPGHIEHLLWAKSRGDILVVHITGDKRFFEKRGRKPIFTEKERASIISSLKPVDYVFIYNGRHYDSIIINCLMPDVLLFHTEAFSEKVKNEVKKLNFKGKIIINKGLNKRNSSSDIVRKIKQRK